MRLVIIALAVTLAPAVPRADGRASSAIGLDDAIALAISRNPALASAMFAVVEADAERTRARGAYDATLEVSTSGQASRRDPRPQPFAQQLASDGGGATVTVVKPFPSGARVTTSATGSVARVTTRIPAVDATQDLAETTYSPKLATLFEVPLLGGRRAGAADHARLEATYDASELEHRAIAEDVVRDVEQAYWELFLAQREVVIRGHNTALAEAQLRVVEAEIARGSRPRLAATEIEDELARRREEQLAAEGAVLERAVILASLLGLPPDTELRAADTPGDPMPVDRAATLARALAHSPRVAAAIRRGDAAGSELERTSDLVGWRLEGFARGTLEGDGDCARDAWTRASGYGGWTIEAGLTVRVPLGRDTQRGTVDAARARLARSRIQIADVEAQVAAAATRSITKLEIALQRRTALAHAVALAQTILDAEQRRWERGDTTAFEVLRRQTALADVQLRAERAHIDAISARAAIDAFTGALIERHGRAARRR